MTTSWHRPRGSSCAPRKAAPPTLASTWGSLQRHRPAASLLLADRSCLTFGTFRPTSTIWRWLTIKSPPAHTYKSSIFIHIVSFLLPDLTVSGAFLFQEVEAKYNNLIRQRPERPPAADADGNKGISINAWCQHMKHYILIRESLPGFFCFLTSIFLPHR